MPKEHNRKWKSRRLEALAEKAFAREKAVTRGALFVVDVGDTLIKGLPYFETLGPVYYFRTVSLLVLSIVAIFVSNRRFHAALVVLALVCELAFILTAHLTMG